MAICADGVLTLDTKIRHPRAPKWEHVDIPGRYDVKHRRTQYVAWWLARKCDMRAGNHPSKTPPLHFARIWEKLIRFFLNCAGIWDFTSHPVVCRSPVLRPAVQWLWKIWFAWTFKDFFSCCAVFTRIWTHRTYDLTDYQLTVDKFFLALTFMWSGRQFPGWSQFSGPQFLNFNYFLLCPPWSISRLACLHGVAQFVLDRAREDPDDEADALAARRPALLHPTSPWTSISIHTA